MYRGRRNHSALVTLWLMVEILQKLDIPALHRLGMTLRCKDGGMDLFNLVQALLVQCLRNSLFLFLPNLSTFVLRVVQTHATSHVLERAINPKPQV